MQLVEYAGLYRKWPPPVRNLAGEKASLDHCLDTLVLASTRAGIEPGCVHIRILTQFKGAVFVRELVLTGRIFARVFCNFLNGHENSTIHEIGEIDVSFLG